MATTRLPPRMNEAFSGRRGRFLSHPGRRKQSVFLDFEDGLAVALDDRLRTADGESPQSRSLRARVLARACVAAMRAASIAYADLPDADLGPHRGPCSWFVTRSPCSRDAFGSL